MSLGERLLDLRKKKGLSQEEINALLNLIKAIKLFLFVSYMK